MEEGSSGPSLANKPKRNDFATEMGREVNALEVAKKQLIFCREEKPTQAAASGLGTGTVVS